MRLIDADKLINQIEQHCIDDEVTCKDDVIEIIEEAPTIEELQSGEWEDFAKFVASEVLDDCFVYNYEAFAELACRRLVELGLVELQDGYYRMKGAKND